MLVALLVYPTQLRDLRLDGNGISPTDVVSSETWKQLNFHRPPDEILKGGFMSLLHYISSEDEIAVNEVRFFVIGESTVRCTKFAITSSTHLQHLF